MGKAETQGLCCGGGAVEGEAGRDRDMIGSSRGLWLWL